MPICDSPERISESSPFSLSPVVKNDTTTLNGDSELYEAVEADTTLAEQGNLPWTVPSITELHKERKRLYSDDEKSRAWSHTADVVKTYSDDMIKRWNTEIDTHLVFAGLFSTILTSFNVQSYQLLQPPAPDPVILGLQLISAQIDSFVIAGGFVNSTRPSFDPAKSLNAPPPPLWAVWLNALWFAGLVLSLASAVICITVKQRLNDHSGGLSGTSREAARLRQHRINRLIHSRVGTVVATVPVLLQLALALFLAGILLLLWNLHPAVASVASALTGMLLLFVLGTAILPMLSRNSFYLSPQALGLYLFWQSLQL